MTVATIQTRIWQRLDDDTTGAGYYRGSELLGAINSAQRLFAFLTLCLEKTVTFGLTANTVFYSMLASYADWLVPLKIRVAGGAKVSPSRLEEMDGRNPAWQAATGDPERYAHLGFDFLAIDPHPSAGGTSLDIVYAHFPAALTSSGTPEISEEYHPALIDGAIALLRTKEGGQEFAESVRFFDRFLEAAQKAASFVRARNLAGRYDNVPFELEGFDRSRLLDLAQRKVKPWLITSQSPQAAVPT